MNDKAMITGEAIPQFITIKYTKYESMLKIIAPIKFIIDNEPEQMREMNELTFGSAWTELRKAVKELV